MNKQQMKKTQFVRLINFVSSCIRKYLRIVISPVAIGQLSVNWTWLMAYISWNYRTQSLSSSKMILHISCQFYRFKLIKFRRKYSYTMDWCGRGIISNILLITPSQQSKQMLRGKKHSFWRLRFMWFNEQKLLEIFRILLFVYVQHLPKFECIWVIGSHCAFQ